MNIKKGDNVVMLAGKDRGKSGKVLSVLKGENSPRVLVSGLNMIKRHQRPRQQGQKGQVISKERAVDLSNVQIICPKCGRPTRIARKMIGDQKIRACKKCQAEL